MANINVSIKNIDEIRSAFNKAPKDMTEELNKAIKLSIFDIQATSMINTPVLTGRLRASHLTLFGALTGAVMTNTNYAMFVHDGTRYMKGRPFMLDAVNKEDRKVQDYFTKAVDNVLAKIARDSK